MSPGTIGGLTWYDDPPDLTDILPILWRVSRMVVGQPATGDAVSGVWNDPRIFSRYGPAGVQGISGLDGIAGARGDDGVGTEFVFARTNSATLPQNQRPLNTWGYDQPGTVNGLQWSDAAPSLTASFPYLWRAQRRVVGQPPIGTAITDTWDEPAVEGRYGEDGDDGIAGARGDDGAGVEYVFAVTNSATLPSSQNPSNTWGYDNPGTQGGLTWHDAAPNVTASTPYLWRAQRAVEGVPALNAAVSDSWSTPTINSRFGPQGIAGIAGSDGSEGATGEDGTGIEFIFAVTNSDTLPIDQRPGNEWGYDNPGAAGGADDHRLLIADNDGDELYELDPDGANTQGTRLRALPTGLTGPQSMTVYNGRLLIADNMATSSTSWTRMGQIPKGHACGHCPPG